MHIACVHLISEALLPNSQLIRDLALLRHSSAIATNLPFGRKPLLLVLRTLFYRALALVPLLLKV